MAAATKRITDFVIEEVSSVDKAANKQTFLITKREGSDMAKFQMNADGTPTAEPTPTAPPSETKGAEPAPAPVVAPVAKEMDWSKIKGALSALVAAVDEMSGGGEEEKAADKDAPKPAADVEKVVAAAVEKAMAPLAKSLADAAAARAAAPITSGANRTEISKSAPAPGTWSIATARPGAARQ